MSLPTPTGNPTPYPPGDFFYTLPQNLAWIAGERQGCETDEQVCQRMEREIEARRTYPAA